MSEKYAQLDTGSIFMLRNLAAANAREGITSSLMPADVDSLCAEVLAMRRAHATLTIDINTLNAANEGLRETNRKQREERDIAINFCAQYRLQRDDAIASKEALVAALEHLDEDDRLSCAESSREMRAGECRCSGCRASAALKAANGQTLCEHKGAIHFGGDLSWCDECGACVWSKDGPAPERGPNRWRQWITERVTAFGCMREAEGASCCPQWCGSPTTCVAAIKAAKGEA